MKLLEKNIDQFLLDTYQDEDHWIYLNSNGAGDNLLAIKTDSCKNKEIDFQGDDRFDHAKWQFGYLGYNLKNDFENLSSRNSRTFAFRNHFFWEPDILVKSSNDQAEFIIGEDLKVPIKNFIKDANGLNQNGSISLIARTSRDEYLEQFKKVKWHIQRGDIYELNYCLEWYSQGCEIDPIETYTKLNSKTRAPFSCLLKSEDQFLICASPERFLKKEGDSLISQPIKGTARRSIDWELDFAFREALSDNIKEQAENVMTTDVVRNDLSRTALKNSVHVSNLNEVQSFKTVHHLVTTVRSTLKKGVSFEEIISTTFPMASMTGAPKISAMKIIDEIESFNREIYSGAVGYITPTGNFDFNVVIRSILYNRKNGYISVPVGSAITAKSDPEKEYDECLLKAEAMKEALQS